MLEQAKEVLIDFKNTPKEDRPWTREIIWICIGIALAVTSFFVFRAEAIKATEDKIKAENQVEILRNSHLKDNKDYNAAVLKAEKDCDEKWSTKFENERIVNRKYLEDYAYKLEQELKSLKSESRKIRSEAKSLKQKVNQ